MRVLILEDDPIIGFDLQCVVESCGHQVVALCETLAEMVSSVDRSIDFAFLDIDLPDGKSFGVATLLDAMNISYAFVSASRPTELPEAVQHARFIAKPYGHAAIRSTLTMNATIAC